MKTKICPVCKRKFIPLVGFQKYCSKECYKIYRKEYLKKYMQKWQQIYKISIAKRHKLYRQTHKEEIKKCTNIYRQINKSRIASCSRKYIKTRLKNDINFKLAHYLRSRINLALKGNPKLETTMKLVGCSIENLKQHLSKKFHPRKDGLEMIFENYGLWHIDHKIPCASFDLSKPEEQAKCFHYTNLQPLWAEENLIKNKY